jgi:hypothetical protein
VGVFLIPGKELKMRKNLYPGLLAELARHGETYEPLGKAIGISRYAVCCKMTGKTEWTIGEIEKICKHFDKDYYTLFK